MKRAFEKLDPVPTTKARQRQAKRAGLDMRVKTTAAQALAQRGINPAGQELDRQRLDKTNLIVVKSAIDRAIAKSVGRKLGERSDYTRPQLDQINENFPAIVDEALQEVSVPRIKSLLFASKWMRPKGLTVARQMPPTGSSVETGA